MWSFAWQNLLTRPSRTFLAIIGLSIPILGIIGLFSLSAGIRNLMGDTLSQVHGLMVLREHVPTPLFSDLPSDMASELRTLPGVRTVAAEVWKIAPPIEGRSLFARSATSLFNPSKQKQMEGLLGMTVIEGQDIAEHGKLRNQVFAGHLLQSSRGGRFLDVADRGKPNAVISTKIARENPGSDGKAKKVGDTLGIGGRPFEIVGIYETGSLVLDATIIMDIDTARKLLGVGHDTVSCYLIEADDPLQLDKIQAKIQSRFSGVDARSTTEFNLNVGRIMGELDIFLLMTVSLALVVGAVGIANTMLMSVSERFVEFGVMRANGWTRKEVLRLVTTESAYMGVLSGIVGSCVAFAVATIANLFLGGGLKLSLNLKLLALGFGLALVMGTLGGLYPAWRASRLQPMDAIRRGAK